MTYIVCVKKRSSKKTRYCILIFDKAFMFLRWKQENSIKWVKADHASWLLEVDLVDWQPEIRRHREVIYADTYSRNGQFRIHGREVGWSEVSRKVPGSAVVLDVREAEKGLSEALSMNMGKRC